MKSKHADKSKTGNNDVKIIVKPVVPVIKPETNACIKVINYWNDKAETNTNDLHKSKDQLSILHMSKNDSDTYSISTNRKSEKDKFKLKKKGAGSEKAPQLRRKQASHNKQNNEKDVSSRKEAFINDKQSSGSMRMNNSNEQLRENPEPNIADKIKSMFSTSMAKRVDNVVQELEAHTNRLEIGRRIIHDRISSIVDRTFNADSVYVQEYGSYATRLLTPYSDMDLSIQGCLMMEREQAVEMLQVLCDNLQLFPFVKSATSILTAIVPVIKIDVDPSIEFENSEVAGESITLKVDIIVDLMDAYNPISTALRTTDYMKYCISNYPSFYKNMLFLKFAMNCNDMTNTYKGGLNAYGLCILYVAYLEFFHLEKSTEAFTLLKGFLQFISTQFSADSQAVYFGTGFRLVKKSDKNSVFQ